MNTYIALDTETGGVTPETSLLTAYFAVLDENLCVVDELDLKVKPDDGNYVVTAQALGINKINLIEHEKVAIPYKDAKTPMYKFLERNYQGEKLIPVGHGIAFDVVRIRPTLISQGSWENFCSYRTLDTGQAAQFLRAAGKFPDNVSGSLGSLVAYFGIKFKGELHDARVDTLQTVAVLRELINLIKGK
jgi:DNA polymerase III alpha subunit (gram-positive type)